MKTDSPSLDANASASAGAASTAADEIVVRLGDRYEILAGQRFEATDRPGQDCFRARRLGQPKNGLLAIATTVLPLARVNIVSHLQAIDQPGLLRCLDSAILDWSGGGRRYVLIFDRPPGPQLMKTMDEFRPPMGEEQLTRVFLGPVYAALRELHQRGVCHGAIRPTNIYCDPTGNGVAALGDCASTPPAYLQPAICEPVERAQADPAGRGAGTPGDDLYALGVTTAILALGRNPLRELDAAAQIELKIERSSYAALIDGARIPSGLVEPLRGLLSDDPQQRWTLDDLGMWLGGRRQNARQTAVARRSPRPIRFDGADVWNARSLAAAMGRNAPEAMKLIKSGEIDRWLRRNLGDQACATRVEAALPNGGRAGGPEVERTVARVCMALDPTAPIRYRGHAVMPSGLGDMFADTMARGGSLQMLAELMTAQLPLFWYNQQAVAPLDAGPTLQHIERCRAFLEKPGFGYGSERTVYEMVPWLPCMSDVVRRFYVAAPANLLPALEATAANSAKRPTTPFDRHIAGFLAARDKASQDALLSVISRGSHEGEKQLAVLNILAGVQRRFGPPELPKLANWFFGLMQAIIERYHSRKTRQRVQQDIAGVVARGDLTQLQQLVDDPQTVNRDQQGFRQAQAGYARLATEIAHIRHYAMDQARLEGTVGRETAALVSTFVAMLLAAGVIVMKLAE